MEIGPWNHSKDGLLGPNSITVVYFYVASGFATCREFGVEGRHCVARRSLEA